jgi:hypothetical protein
LSYKLVVLFLSLVWVLITDEVSGVLYLLRVIVKHLNIVFDKFSYEIIMAQASLSRKTISIRLQYITIYNAYIVILLLLLLV